MSALHPTYPNPTIIQVTCEIAFASEAEVKLRAATLYPIFVSEFPEIQPVQTSFQLQVLVGPRQMPPEPPQSANAAAFRFATPDGKRFVQLSQTNFVYQLNDPYPGWKLFREKLMELWSASLVQIAPTTVTKIGLRYINRIVKTKINSHPSDWLQPTADLPAALLSSKEHFLGRIESSPKPSHLRLITLASEPPGPDWPLGSIVLDIDRVTTEAFAANPKQILKNLELLHEDIWTSFDSAATKSLKSHLSGKRK